MTMSIIIPAFNEGENIYKVTHDTVNVMRESNFSRDAFEVIIVNDGSADNTEAQAIKVQQSLHNFDVKLLNHKANKGLSEALKTGLCKATKEYVSYVPGDGEITADELVKFYNAIGDNDILVSNRVTLKRPLLRKVLSWGNRTLIRLILGVDFRKLEGLFFIKTPLGKAIAENSSSDVLYLELILYCIKQKLKITRMNMKAGERLNGKSKVTNLKHILRTFQGIIKLRSVGTKPVHTH